MKKNQIEDARKAWNADHATLRRLLEKGQDTPKAIEVFLHHHAMVHSNQLKAGDVRSFQDEILQDVTEEQIRLIPPGQTNSALWMIWHITRIEDATINVLLADAPQLFHRGKWQAKLHSPYVDVGNGMTKAEVQILSQSVDIKALFKYRLAVARRTREVVQKVKAEHLREKPLPALVESLAADGTVRENAGWLLSFWGGHPNFNLLLMPASRHPLVHLNEISRMLPKLRRLTEK
jgi:hypothetical protein